MQYPQFGPLLRGPLEGMMERGRGMNPTVPAEIRTDDEVRPARCAFRHGQEHHGARDVRVSLQP